MLNTTDELGLASYRKHLKGSINNMVAGSADNIFLVGNYGDDDIWMRNVGD